MGVGWFLARASFLEWEALGWGEYYDNFSLAFLIPFVEGSSTGFFLELVSCTIFSVLARLSLA